MPHSTSLIASDGLEYENLAQRLLGKPKDTWRNQQIKALRQSFYKEAEVRAYYEAYDCATDCPIPSPLIGDGAGWRAVHSFRLANPG